MTRRVLASFVLVLVAMIAFVEIPLGLQLASHEREDFRQTTAAAAQSLAAASEEVLGDADQQSGATRLHLDVDAGDSVVVANRDGDVIATFGSALPTASVERALHRQSTDFEDRTLAIAEVGDSGTKDGTVLLARSSEPLDHRLAELTVVLIAAAVGALTLGAGVAIVLARWIGRPVDGLRRVATEMGTGNLEIRAAEVGPQEIRELAGDFNRMAGRIGDLLSNQRAMTSDVSHQLRTPLAALRLRLENVRAEAPADLENDLTATLGEINRLSRLTDGLLAVARAEEDTVTPEPVPVDAVIAERLALWGDLAVERAVALTDDSEPNVALLGPGHLEQMLDNLIANALEVAPAGSSVSVASSQAGSQVSIAVVDHGPGLPAAARERAFQRFSGLNDQASRSAGLGLAIVGSLAKANHGSARLEATAGGGLTVVLLLPAADEVSRSRRR